ncbi:hypothetical protein TthAA37_22060 (plasmid) [Thermus thermophilus]|uniref:histidine kinase n=1 Tax=Thermus thermophilus TaxID=274 RepID=A0AAD1KW43_THETH|nr:HAMP domain-containing sensor histidine kinase [Thermus thermophilus]BBL83351.1 hypothetical protein TthAA220_21350 [Thermus thermophilus]BBL85624.1 hypothetical protein TthAA229_21050 [Thermus thermophilus]BCZ88031.1 hypothetical protein TthAA11_22130 [Thermus thermophilus]BCZ90353.1 hypothetical protein TthAA22_21580 [Thermus thermophilus]BCZ93017.1 hypothetical protein TthAA37_22060 [Thermus thermophilus]
MGEENGRFLLEAEGEAFPADLALYLVVGGRAVAQRGPPFPLPSRLPEGCFSQGEVRYCALPGEGFRLVAARSLEWADRAMDRAERLLLLAFSGALALAFLLGYLLAGRALAPLDRMARRALALAQAPDPKGRLPEPPRLDEVGRLARAQNLLLDSLERLLESERRFVRHAAHELRTPLTALIGRLEQALERDPPPRRPLERALEAALHLKALSERLLLLARADAPLKREPLDLGGGGPRGPGGPSQGGEGPGAGPPPDPALPGRPRPPQGPGAQPGGKRPAPRPKAGGRPPRPGAHPFRGRRRSWHPRGGTGGLLPADPRPRERARPHPGAAGGRGPRGVVRVEESPLGGAAFRVGL